MFLNWSTDSRKDSIDFDFKFFPFDAVFVNETKIILNKIIKNVKFIYF